jgi:riboflavin kinase/FMN adenylyltransferase
MNSPDRLQPDTGKRYCAAVGFFDGVHLGHASLMHQLKETAEVRGETALAITFDRHPRTVIQSDFIPELLITTEEKRRLLMTAGADECLILPFNKQLASMTAREFLDMVRDTYQVHTLLVGYDHRFGRPQGETFADYERMGREIGIDVLHGEPFLVDDVPVSSSRIRQSLTEGRVDEAKRLLGRPYSFQATVIHGHHVGHSLGFPTANFDVADLPCMLPANGSYLVQATPPYTPGMLYIGTRPTFEGSERTAEVHLFDTDADLYGLTLRVEFLWRLREERHFDSPEALRRQLTDDREQALSIIRNTSSES